MKRLSLALAVAASLVASSARADDCPPGSRLKTEEGFTWCEPVVCSSDIHCSPGETCAPSRLCIQIGTTDTEGPALAADASKRLIATQLCGPRDECPDTTVCSALSRCVPKVFAEKNTPSSPPPSLPTGPVTVAASDGVETKSKCGCELPGAFSAPSAAAPLAVLAALTALRRRIRRDPAPCLQGRPPHRG